MKLSELSTKELLEKAWNEISALCGSRGVRKDWRMTIPVDADRDSDVLFGEVLRRLAQLEAENDRLKAEVKRLRVLAYDYIQAYEKLVFGDDDISPQDQETWNAKDN